MDKNIYILRIVHYFLVSYLNTKVYCSYTVYNCDYRNSTSTSIFSGLLYFDNETPPILSTRAPKHDTKTSRI
jgi:hypothetical protein